jgi:predicted PurR-regulated permease PerM
MSRNSELHTVVTVAQLLGVMLVVTALYVARDVFIPLALAILLSFLFTPVVNRLQRLGVRNVWAVLVTAFCAFTILASGLTLVGRELSVLVADLPQYKEEVITKVKEVAGLRSGMGKELDDLAADVSQAIEEIDEGSREKRSEEAPSQSELEENSPLIASLSPAERFAAKLFGPEEPQEQTHDGQSADSPIYIRVAPGNSMLSWAGTIGSLLGPLGTAGLVTVFMLFLLVYRDDMRDRIIKIISQGNYVTTTEAIHEVAKRISQYLLAQTVVNVSYGIVLCLGLFMIGKWLTPQGTFPNLILWGALATLLRFVPYVGPVVAAVLPLAFSLVVFPGYQVTFALLTLIVTMELISNNVLEPLLYGASTGISAVAVILGAVFWGWLWGPVGLLLSTPITVCLVVLGRHVPKFKLLATLLGDRVDVRPSLRFYQRLLAEDEHSAGQLLKDFSHTAGWPKALDRVVIPAMRRIEADQEIGHLKEKEAVELTQRIQSVLGTLEFETATQDQSRPATQVETEIARATEGASLPPQEAAEVIVDDLPDAEDPNAGGTSALRVVASPSHHVNEEGVLHVLANSSDGCKWTVFDSSVLPNRISEYTREVVPDVVLIMVIPQGGFTQARYLCRAVRAKGFAGIVIVCCCGRFRNFDKIFARFRHAGANFVTTSVTQTDLKLTELSKREMPAHSPRPPIDNLFMLGATAAAEGPLATN